MTATSTEKRKIDVLNAHDELSYEKTSPASIYRYKNGQFQINFSFYRRTYDKAVTKCFVGYPSRRSAEEEAPIIRYAIENKLDKHWVSYINRDNGRMAISDSIMVPYRQWLAQTGLVQSSEEAFNAAAVNQLFRLSSVEHTKFKKLRIGHSGEEKIDRASFKLSKFFADGSVDNSIDTNHHVSSKIFARGIRSNSTALRGKLQKAVAVGMKDHVRHMCKQIPEYEAKITSTRTQICKLAQVVSEGLAFTMILDDPEPECSTKDEGMQTTSDHMMPTQEDFTNAQNQRVHRQCTIVLRLLEKLEVRYITAEQLMKNYVHSYSCYCTDTPQAATVNQLAELVNREKEDYITLLKALNTLRQESAMPILAGDVETERFNNKLAPVSWRTILLYLNEYRNHGGFAPDRRGKHNRDVFLETFGLEKQFVFFLKSCKDLSIQKVSEFLFKLIVDEGLKTIDANHVETRLKGEDMKRELEDFGIKMPFAHSTIHRWMIKCGARYCAAKQSYYTDRHDAPDTIKYRETVYIPTMNLLSLRAAEWVTVNEESATEIAIKDARKVLGLPSDSKLPKDEEGRIQIHVDFLRDDLHCEFREKMCQKTGHPGELHRCFALESDYRRMHQTSHIEKLGADAIVHTSICGGLTIDDIQGSLIGSICLCRFDHQESICKCKCPVLLLGQDETVHKQNNLAKRYWSVDGKQKLRKKTEGKGLMMSVFIDSYHGFGLPLQKNDVDSLSESSASLDKFPVIEDPWTKFVGIEFRDYSKDGYWTGDDFIASTHTTIEKMASLHPNLQIALEADHSSGHLKKEGNHLNVSNMNLNFGGKQSQLRDSVLTESCLGSTLEYVAHRRDGSQLVYRRLNPGDAQKFTFVEDDLPPYKSPDTPKHARRMTHDEEAHYRSRRSKKDKEILPDELVIEGYVGKEKGIYQILVERGLYVAGMRGEQNEKAKIERQLAGMPPFDPLLDAHQVLRNCEDFLNEKSAVEMALAEAGNIFVPSPICHPELAGSGVEYQFGKVKMVYRRNTNDCVAANIERNVMKAVSMACTSERLFKFIRKTHSYRRLYRDKDDPGGPIPLVVDGKVSKEESEQYEYIEKMVKTYRSHRNIEKIETDYLSSS